MNSPTSTKKYISALLVATLLSQLWPGSALSALPLPGASHPITLIQDIHAHVEAQKSIQDTLEKLQKKKGRGLVVGIEGASGAFDFSPYRMLSDQNLTQSIADQLLEEGLVAGPVREGFLNSSINLQGVEDPTLYIQNVEAYRRAEPLQKNLLSQLNRIRHHLHDQKVDTFSPELKKFDALVESYRGERAELSEYIQGLLDAGAAPHFSVEIFQAARQSENNLSLAAVEREKARFVRELVSKLGGQELSWSKDLSISRRLETLLQTARARGVDTNLYPKLLNYVRYLKLAEAVDTAALFSDLAAMEAETYARLIQNSPAAQELVHQSRTLYLTEKLVKFELSPEEWAEYKKAEIGNWKLDRGVIYFQDFYRVAEQRNQAIVRRIAETNAEAVVVGGFHTPGLKYLLEAMGRKVEIVRPQISKIDLEAGSTYLNVFAQKKTPLEKFLLRWKLFLAHPASLGTTALIETTQPSASNELLRRYELLNPSDGKIVHRILHGLRAGTNEASAAAPLLSLIPLLMGLAQHNATLFFLGFLGLAPGLLVMRMTSVPHPNSPFERVKAEFTNAIKEWRKTKDYKVTRGHSPEDVVTLLFDKYRSQIAGQAGAERNMVTQAIATVYATLTEEELSARLYRDEKAKLARIKDPMGDTPEKVFEKRMEISKFSEDVLRAVAERSTPENTRHIVSAAESALYEHDLELMKNMIKNWRTKRSFDPGDTGAHEFQLFWNYVAGPYITAFSLQEKDDDTKNRQRALAFAEAFKQTHLTFDELSVRLANDLSNFSPVLSELSRPGLLISAAFSQWSQECLRFGQKEIIKASQEGRAEAFRIITEKLTRTELVRSPNAPFTSILLQGWEILGHADMEPAFQVRSFQKIAEGIGRVSSSVSFDEEKFRRLMRAELDRVAGPEVVSNTDISRAHSPHNSTSQYVYFVLLVFQSVAHAQRHPDLGPVLLSETKEFSLQYATNVFKKVLSTNPRENSYFDPFYQYPLLHHLLEKKVFSRDELVAALQKGAREAEISKELFPTVLSQQFFMEDTRYGDKNTVWANQLLFDVWEGLIPNDPRGSVIEAVLESLVDTLSPSRDDLFSQLNQMRIGIMTQEQLELSHRFTLAFGYLMAVIRSPRIEKVKAATRDMIVNAELPVVMLLRKLLLDLTHIVIYRAQFLTIDPGFLELWLSGVMSLYQSVREKYDQEGFHERSHALQQAMDVFQNARDTTKVAFQAWRNESNHSPSMKDEDPVTDALQNLYALLYAPNKSRPTSHLVALGVAAAYREMNITEAELRVRGPRDVKVLTRAQLDSAVESEHNEVFVLEIYGQLSNSMRDDQTKFAFSKMLNAAWMETVKNLFLEAMTEWRSRQKHSKKVNEGDEKFRRLMLRLEKCLRSLSPLKAETTKVVAGVLTDSKLSREEVMHRMTQDFSEGCNNLKTLVDKNRWVVQLYQSLPDEHSALVQTALLRSIPLVAVEFATGKFMEWKKAGSSPDAVPLESLEDDLMQAIVVLKAYGSETTVLEEMSVGIAAVAKAADVKSIELERMFRRHMGNRVEKWIQDGYRSSSFYFQVIFGLYLKNFSEDEYDRIFTESMQENIQAIANNFEKENEAAFIAYIKFVQAFGFGPIKFQKSLTKAFAAQGWTEDQRRDYFEKQIQMAVEKSRSEFFGFHALVTLKLTLESLSLNFLTLERYMDPYFDGPEQGSFPLLLVCLNLASRYTNDEERKEFLKPLGDRVRALDLSAEQFEQRVEKEVADLFAHWMGLPHWAAEESFRMQALEENFVSLADVYLQAAKHYSKNGKPMLAQAITNGLVNSLETLFKDTQKFQRFQVHVLPLLFNLLGDLRELESARAIRRTVALIKSVLTPSLSIQEYAGFVTRTTGQSYQFEGKFSAALSEGLEAAMAIDLNTIQYRVVPVDTWASAIHEAINLGRLHLILNNYRTAVDYFEAALRVWERHPKVSQTLADVERNQLEGFLAAAHLALERDPTVLRDRFKTVEEKLGPFAVDGAEGEIPFLEFQYILSESLAKACRTGDRRYFDLLMKRSAEKSTGQPEDIEIFTLIEALVTLLRYSPRSDAPELIAIGNTLLARFPEEYENFSSREQAMIGLARVEWLSFNQEEVQARQLHQRILEAVEKTPELLGFGNLQARNNVLRSGYLSLAASASLDGGDQAIEIVAGFLRKAMSYTTYETHYYEDAGGFVFPAHVRRDTVLGALERVITETTNQELPMYERVYLIRLYKQLARAEDEKGQGQYWLEKIKKLSQRKNGLAWPEGLSQLLQEIFEEDIQKTFNATKKEAWPSGAIYQWNFPRKCEQYKKRFLKTLEEVPDFTTWTRVLPNLRAEIYFEAGNYALAGFSRESEQLMNLPAYFSQEAAKHFQHSRKEVPIETMDIQASAIAFAGFCSDVPLAISIAMQIYRDFDKKMSRPFWSYVTYAAEFFWSYSWVDTELMKKTGDHILELMRDFLKSVPDEDSHVTVAHKTIALVYHRLGMEEEAHRAMRRSVFVHDEKRDTLEPRDGADREVLSWIPFVKRQTELSLQERLLVIEARLDQIGAESRRVNIQPLITFHRIVLKLMDHASDPADVRAIAQRLLNLLEKLNDDQHAELFGLGLPLQMAEVAVLGGVESAESQKIIEKLKIYKHVWIGPGADVDLARAIRFVEAFGKQNPASYLDEPDDSPYADLWRMVAAYRAGLKDRAAEELKELVAGLHKTGAETFRRMGILRSLMESPMAREAFLAIVLDLLQSFRADDWKNGSPDKTKEAMLRNIVLMASQMGDNRVLFAFDTLLAHREFPLKSILSAPHGPMALMEAPLTVNDWEERFQLLPDITDQRRSELVARAKELLKKDPEITERIDQAARTQKTVQAERNLVRDAIQASARLCADFKFAEASAALNRIATQRRTEEWRQAHEKIVRYQAVWDVYQTGETARALLLPMDKDPVASALVARIFEVDHVFNALGNRYLAEAEQSLAAIKVPTNHAPDKGLENVRTMVANVRKNVNASFAKVQTEVANLIKGQGAGANLRRTVQELYGKDKQNEEAVELLLSMAQLLMNKEHKKYATAQGLMHILFFDANLWELEKVNAKFAASAREAERTRKLARAYEMRELHQRQLDTYTAAMDATIHIENNTPNGESTFKGKLFHVRDVWTVNSQGMVVIPFLQELVKTSRRTAAGQPVVEKKEVKSLRELDFPPGRDFLFTLNVRGTIIRLPLNFVRTQNVDGEALLFMTDSEGLEILRAIQNKKEKYDGTLIYVQQVEYILYSVHLSHTVRYLSEVIATLEKKGAEMVADQKLEKLLGLDITPQAIDPDTSFERIQVEGRATPIASQDDATRAGLSAPVTLVQGPPGTGKSHVLTQIISTAVSVLRKLFNDQTGEPDDFKAASRHGEIVVLTATSHAAVDAIAKKITDQNVALVRFASKEGAEKIHPDVYPYFENNLAKLWKLIRLHHKTGQGFVVAGTIMGIFGDRKCMTLFQMYMNGFSMSEIEKRYVSMGGALDTKDGVLQYELRTKERTILQPICAIDEAGQSNTAQTEIIYFSFHPSRWLLFGDHFQLPPYFSADDFRELFREAIKRGFVPTLGSIDNILTPETVEAMSTSIFELVHTHGEKWGRTTKETKQAAGIALGFLDHALRSVWPIAELISQVFYGSRLKHRQAALPRHQWDPFEKDTVMVLETKGQAIQEEKGTSFVNFQEVGMVIQTVTYYLNLKDAKNHYRYNPEDIFIISPYKAQVQLIREVIQVTAVLNDVLRGDPISFEEIEKVCLLIQAHWNVAGKEKVDSIQKLLESFKTAEHRRVPNANLLLAKLTSLYDLHSDEIRTIRREFLPKNGNGHHAPVGQFFFHLQTTQEGKGAKANKGDVLDVDTIDSVQGGEKKVVVASLVRHDGRTGFLSDYRLNVAFSRAKNNLAIVTSQGIQLQRLDNIVKVMKKLKPTFAVLTSVPRTTDKPTPPASLRAALGWSTGHSRTDDRIDVYGMPPLETIVFLSLLALGIHHSDGVLIAVGIFLKAILFPALHIWIAPERYRWKKELPFSSALTALYLFAWLVCGHEMGAMLPIVLVHTFRNRKSITSRELQKALPIQKWGVDALEGAPALLNYQVPNAAPVLSPKATHYRFAESRA